MPIQAHILFILFFFALGACVGSFLNVVVWRLPRGESLVHPRSHCPKCNTNLAWYDNIPVFGWIALRGKCRYCKQPISARYPIIEAITGGMFVLYYVMFFIRHEGPCGMSDIMQDWPMYGLYMLLLSALLAASLIDAELFIIPIEIPWLVALIGLIVHAIIDMPHVPGALNVPPLLAAISAGAGVGLVISILLMRRGLIQQSFAEGGPLLEVEKKAIAEQERERKRERDARGSSSAVDYESVPPMNPPPEFTPAEIRAEMRKEMLFLMPPMLLGGLWLLLCWKVPFVASFWVRVASADWVSGFLGALWGAMVGGFVVWFWRIAGSLAFGREAMGLGDVHLMFGVGAVIGAAGATLAFFIAPFFGLIYAVYRLMFHGTREIPFGPYLSMATAVVVLFYCRFYLYLAPQMTGLAVAIRQAIGI